MITDCPSCSRQFRIYAWQLTAAKGVVQCGFCGEQFNALERLRDYPLVGDDKNQVSVSHDDELDEPQFKIPGENQDLDPKESQIVDPHQNLTNVDNEYYGEAQDSIATDAIKPQSTDLLSEDEVLELLVISDEKRSPWSSFFWVSSIVLLLVMVAIQLTWFNRDWILTNKPEYLPFAKKVCERIECELVRERDLSSIVLVNRDVRDHPRYVNTLLVNATIENQSEIIQPFPDLRMVLYDTEGEISGYRIFKPLEYLDPSISIEDGMFVNAPVHIILELTGATDVAVSFEFKFI